MALAGPVVLGWVGGLLLASDAIAQQASLLTAAIDEELSISVTEPYQHEICVDFDCDTDENRRASSLAPPRNVGFVVTFKTGSSALTPQSKRVLDRLGALFIAKRNYISRVTVEGHTDSSGSISRNMVLSRERAESVKRYLGDAYGIRNVDTKGWGSQHPIVRDNPKAAANRRIEFRVQYH